MISFDAGGNRFNLRGAGVVLHRGAVLLHRLEGDAFWSVPGGRVEGGEVAADAVVREFREELSEAVECDGLLWVVENFFSYRGQPHHEVGLYFRVRLAPQSRLLAAPGPYMGDEGGQALTFDWFDIAGLHALDVRPSLLAQALSDGDGGAFRHIVHHDLDVPAGE